MYDKRISHHCFLFIGPMTILCCLHSVTDLLQAADWPMWRHDARRGAATTQELLSPLHLQWVRELPPLKTAWPDQAKMVFDRNYEPIVMGSQMFVGSSWTDSLTAYDTRTGEKQWEFFTEGPVRFAPAADRGKVYFVSDDSYLYCVDAKDGSLVWKVRGGPSDRKILGNGRLISVWPARGGPVLADSTVYFGASIWPFMGIFIHAVDAETGERVWLNDGDGANYIIQPHGAYSFAGVTPQGAMCVAGDRLFVPGGRSVPACLDRANGKQIYFQHGRRGGGSDVFGLGDFFVNNGDIYDSQTGDSCGRLRGALAFDQDGVYLAERNSIRALPYPKIKTSEEKDRRGRKKTVRTAEFGRQHFAVEGSPITELIRVGSRFYGAKDDQILAVDFPEDRRSGKRSEANVAWRTRVEGQVVRLLAADDRLFAVTLAGRIYCFGGENTEPNRFSATVASSSQVAESDDQRARVKEILRDTKIETGHCVLWGIGDGGLAAELLDQSKLYVVAIDPDAAKVTAARRRFANAGLYGRRISVHVGDPQTFNLPPYLARLMVAVKSDAEWLRADKSTVKKIYASLRPFGGTACLDLADDVRRSIVNAVDRLNLPQARIVVASDRLLVSRAGALPGSGNWTHEHADAANTRVSPDKIVKAPFGVLWFGGPSHDPILPRHGHGPQPQVIDGRLIIEGPDLLRCLDIYTGSVLWERNLPGVGALYNNTAHHPGANGTGANYISVADGIYVLYGKVCLRLDPNTGRTISEFKLPAAKDTSDSKDLCYINVAGEYLVLGCDTRRTETGKRDYEDYISCERLSVLDRQSGKQLWSLNAQFQFRNNAICIGGSRLYCVDLLSDFELKRLERRGEKTSQPSKLSALELKTGKRIWQSEDKVFGTWLSYSDRHDMLFESGRPGGDTLRGEPGGMRAFRANDGKLVWNSRQNGPAMVHGDRILNGSGRGFEILTGERLTRTDPITGKSQTWGWSRNYGCNTPQASEHLLVFRSGAAGFYDLARDGGTGNFGGFKSSCTNNLIVAGGVLTAPDYTRTCGCAYQNQTSLAMIHMPESELWTFTPFDFDEDRPVQRLGINFGAPGDRRADDGTLWIDHPSVGGDSPKVPVRVTGDKLRFVRHHVSRLSTAENNELPWVSSSAAIGAQEVSIPLGGGKSDATRSYRVRLFFAETEGLQLGERVFDIVIGGETVEENFDIAKAAGGVNRSVVKEFHAVKARSNLNLSFVARKGEPIIGGIEVTIDRQVD